MIPTTIIQEEALRGIVVTFWNKEIESGKLGGEQTKLEALKVIRASNQTPRPQLQILRLGK